MSSAPQWWLGTMGFGYADWRGTFYPARPVLSGPGKLAEYSQTFNAVELDSTFHATPPRDRVASWADAIADDRRASFRFTAKLCKQFTHADRPLDTDQSLELLDQHRRSLEPLFESGLLRAVLWQFPPSLTSEALPELLRAIDTWPIDWPMAVEVRDDSWWQPGVGPALAKKLRERNAAWVIADEPPKTIAMLSPDDAQASTTYQPRSPILTGDWFYVRWIGRHEQFPDLAEQRLDPTGRLKWWADKLLGVLAGGRVKEIVGFFNNGYSGHSPLAARKMRDLLDLPNPPAPAARAAAKAASERLF